MVFTIVVLPTENDTLTCSYHVLKILFKGAIFGSPSSPSPLFRPGNSEMNLTARWERWVTNPLIPHGSFFSLLMATMCSLKHLADYNISVYIYIITLYICAPWVSKDSYFVCFSHKALSNAKKEWTKTTYDCKPAASDGEFPSSRIQSFNHDQHFVEVL